MAILCASGSSAFPQHLVFTLPSHGQYHWTESGSDDSLHVECAGGPEIRELQSVYLWGQPVSGGGFALLDSHLVVGMEGLPDSFPTPFPGHFYVMARNAVGLSCASNLVTVPPDVLTGVEVSPQASDPVLLVHLFDVRGRLVGKFPPHVWHGEIVMRFWELRPWMAGLVLPSGIYFMRGKTKRGYLTPRKVLVVK